MSTSLACSLMRRPRRATPVTNIRRSHCAVFPAASTQANATTSGGRRCAGPGFPPELRSARMIGPRRLSPSLPCGHPCKVVEGRAYARDGVVCQGVFLAVKGIVELFFRCLEESAKNISVEPWGKYKVLARSAMRTDAFFRWTELDCTTYPAWRDGIVAPQKTDEPPRRQGRQDRKEKTESRRNTLPGTELVLLFPCLLFLILASLASWRFIGLSLVTSRLLHQAHDVRHLPPMKGEVRHQMQQRAQY
jgi:hypothetical protein